MATVNPSIKRFGEHTAVVTWANIAAGDTVNPIGAQHTDFADRNVQMESGGGSGFNGGTVTLQGSNEETPTNWQSLTDPQGNAIAKTAAALEQITEATVWVRPSPGASVANVTVTMLMRRGRGGMEV